MTARQVAAVASMDSKGRYEVDGNYIRAVYGHSVDVAIQSGDTAPSAIPETLYHGTAEGNLDAILTDGLRPMSRQKVH